MSPLDVKNKILVLLLASHHAYGLSLADEDAVLDAPSIGRGIYVDPSGEILSIEEIDPLGNLGGPGYGGKTNKDRNGKKKAEETGRQVFHTPDLSSLHALGKRYGHSSCK
tara:strand:- start:408 stop:737 length:330 start_codon:yes stop_codon:yes gene_type:complete